MRKGNNPSVVETKSHQLLAIATGSDFCAEHEWGMEEMLLRHTESKASTAEKTADLLQRGVLKSAPNLFEDRRISNNLDKFYFVEELDGSEVVATLVCIDDCDNLQAASNYLNQSFTRGQLEFPRFGEPKDLAAAWDAASFAFKVKGAHRVAQLRAFYEKLKEGQVGFAGLYLKDLPGTRLAGVILWRLDLLSEEHIQQVQKAQVDYERNIELWLNSKMKELRELNYKRKPSLFYFWPVWQEDGSIGYCINSDLTRHDKKLSALYSNGRIGYDDLKSWLTSS